MGSGQTEPTALGSDSYDAMWRQLEDFLRYNPGARHRRRLVLGALRRHAGNPSSLLDIGCGVGEMIAFLSDELEDCGFTGVDFSPTAIESCRRRMPEHRWAVADVTSDDVSGAFDAVVCSELLEHLDEPANALKRIVPALRTGGLIVVTVPNGKVFATERAFGHVRHPTIRDLRAWFAAADLDVLEARCWGWPGYLALKYLANVDADRALDAFGSGRYSWPARRANDVAWALAGATSLRDNTHGPQTVIVGRRRAT